MRYTVEGCACVQIWKLTGADRPCLEYCCNPDNYSEGDWCIVVNNTCQGNNWGLCQAATQDPGDKVSTTTSSKESSNTLTVGLHVNGTFRLSGACDSSSLLNDRYVYAGVTASGAPFFKSDSGVFMYHDQDCNDGGAAARWVLDVDEPETSKTRDLDEDGQCSYIGRMESEDTSGPRSGNWRMTCGGDLVDQTLMLELEAATTSSQHSKRPLELLTSTTTLPNGTGSERQETAPGRAESDEMPWIVIGIAAFFVTVLACSLIYYKCLRELLGVKVKPPGRPASMAEADLEKEDGIGSWDRSDPNPGSPSPERRPVDAARDNRAPPGASATTGYSDLHSRAATSDAARRAPYAPAQTSGAGGEGAKPLLQKRCLAERYSHQAHGQSRCALCLIALKDAELIRRLLCPARHAFHASCIDCWFSRSTCCPVCHHEHGAALGTHPSSRTLESFDGELMDMVTDDDESIVSVSEWDPHSFDDSNLHIAIEVGLSDVWQQSAASKAFAQGPGARASKAPELDDAAATRATTSQVSTPAETSVERTRRCFDVQLKRDSASVPWGIVYRAPRKSRCQAVLAVEAGSPAEAWQKSCVACTDLARLLRRGDRLSMVNGVREALAMEQELALSTAATLTFKRRQSAAHGSAEIDQQRWTCPACDELNRSERESCNNCGRSRLAGAEAAAKPRPERSVRFVDDAASRTKAPVVDGAAVQPERSDDSKNTGRGDLDLWDCPVCNEPNRITRLKCNNCGKDKPERISRL
eukprot:TRINITY_DN20902_c0_g1_i3.p1 TRINITY_DN20902_c0_g1~~TRINITY_DN20902_c0_g1_i3.p1  ORF type:complete len:755 (+),score=116.15 TRINITY_DN20902_c0_g1_i3:91-2355(+)